MANTKDVSKYYLTGYRVKRKGVPGFSLAMIEINGGKKTALLVYRALKAMGCKIEVREHVTRYQVEATILRKQ